MSPKRRVAFVLCGIEGLSPSEAGAIEGVPSLVMRARLLQARGDIARLMKGDPLAEALMRTEGGEP
jgi:RNA polymerase sigma-70 factor (ECF subfamily)